ncbi:MAG: hypothetical protein ABW101_08250 [Candidatus Thiodiazotropha sp.]
MQISPDLVQWDVVTKKAAAGTLEHDLYEIRADDEWADNECTWFNDSFIHYCQVGDAVDFLVPKLKGVLKDNCERSLALILNETCNMPRELGDALNNEYFVSSISPEQISSLIVVFENVDMNELLSEYQRIIPDDLQSDIGEPKENFIGYIEQWINLLKEARAKNMGLFVHVG